MYDGESGAITWNEWRMMSVTSWYTSDDGVGGTLIRRTSTRRISDIEARAPPGLLSHVISQHAKIHWCMLTSSLLSGPRVGPCSKLGESLATAAKAVSQSQRRAYLVASSPSRLGDCLVVISQSFHLQLPVSSHETYPEEEHTSLLENYLLFFHDLFQVFKLDCSALERYDFGSVRSSSSRSFKEDSPTIHTPFLSPHIDTVDSSGFNIGFRLSIEDFLRALVAIVSETIPLRASLCMKQTSSALVLLDENGNDLWSKRCWQKLERVGYLMTCQGAL